MRTVVVHLELILAHRITVKSICIHLRSDSVHIRKLNSGAGNICSRQYGRSGRSRWFMGQWYLCAALIQQREITQSISILYSKRITIRLYAKDTLQLCLNLIAHRIADRFFMVDLLQLHIDLCDPRQTHDDRGHKNGKQCKCHEQLYQCIPPLSESQYMELPSVFFMHI